MHRHWLGLLSGAAALLGGCGVGPAPATTSSEAPSSLTAKNASAKVLRSFYQDWASTRYAQAAEMLRTSQGQPYTAAATQQLVASWKSALGTRSPLTIAHLTIAHANPLPATALHTLHAQQGYAVTFALSGTSRTPCFHLPLSPGFVQIIAQHGQWYLASDFLPMQGCLATTGHTPVVVDSTSGTGNMQEWSLAVQPHRSVIITYRGSAAVQSVTVTTATAPLGNAPHFHPAGTATDPTMHHGQSIRTSAPASTPPLWVGQLRVTMAWTQNGHREQGQRVLQVQIDTRRAPAKSPS